MSASVVCPALCSASRSPPLVVASMANTECSATPFGKGQFHSDRADVSVTTASQTTNGGQRCSAKDLALSSACFVDQFSNDGAPRRAVSRGGLGRRRSG